MTRRLHAFENIWPIYICVTFLIHPDGNFDIKVGESQN